MHLLIDIGNTRIKWRWAQGHVLQSGGAELLPAPGHEAALFARIWMDAGKPERVVVSNVAGEGMRNALVAWTRATWGREPLVVSSSAQCGGVKNGYQDPAALGVDRWCALIGARASGAAPACIVDCGTAITVDLLSGEGAHLGGLIIPGLRAMIRALSAAARGVKTDVVPVPATAPLGHSTAECIRAGILAAATGAVEHTLDRLALPAETAVFLTGGDAALLASALRRPCRIEPNLVFLGLLAIAADGGHA